MKAQGFRSRQSQIWSPDVCTFKSGICVNVEKMDSRVFFSASSGLLLSTSQSCSQRAKAKVSRITWGVFGLIACTVSLQVPSRTWRSKSTFKWRSMPQMLSRFPLLEHVYIYIYCIYIHRVSLACRFRFVAVVSHGSEFAGLATFHYSFRKIGHRVRAKLHLSHQSKKHP